MKRSGFKRKVIERKPVTHAPIPEALRRGASMGQATLTPVPKGDGGAGKSKTADERRHMDAVAQLGCAVCWRVMGIFTPLVHLHHPRRGAGMGQRASHMDTLPVCPEHHVGATGIHGLGTKGFEKHYGFSEADLLLDVQVRLGVVKDA